MILYFDVFTVFLRRRSGAVLVTASSGLIVYLNGGNQYLIEALLATMTASSLLSQVSLFLFSNM